MTTQHGPDLVERVRSAVDIVTLISEFVSLKKSGRKYRGLCPFHNEKTPSFYVDETKQLFYCFGCSVGGDIFKFVMLQEGVDFRESLRTLARRAGITVPEPGATGRQTSEREAMLRACREAQAVYRKILLEERDGEPGRQYLKRRGVDTDTARELGLGFAPDRWDTLRGSLSSRNLKPELLMAAGLVIKRESGSGFYDRFRNRVTFPIVNPSGDVIGFGGRLIGEGEPKYLNSPETLIYNKRQSLYGLYHSRQAIKSAGEAIVVEGYLDFASMYQAGIRNVVATLGTSFTAEQVGLLKRFAQKVVVNYDGDAAGVSAARRSLETLLAQGVVVRVLQLPEGQDPDAFVREASPEAYRDLLQEAPSCFDFLVEAASGERDLSNPGELAAAVSQIVPILAQVPSRIERSRYLGLLAERLGIEDDLLLAEIRDRLIKDGKTPSRTSPSPAREGAAAGEPSEAEARLVRGLVEDPGCRSRLLGEILPADLEGSRVAGIISGIAGLESSEQPVSYADLSAALGDRDRELLARIGMRGEGPPDAEEAEDCLQALRRARLVRERKGVQKEMERAADPQRLEELMKRKLDLSRQIDGMC